MVAIKPPGQFIREIFPQNIHNPNYFYYSVVFIFVRNPDRVIRLIYRLIIIS